MKNIHILSTDKPSRLHLAYNKDYYLSVEPFIQLDTNNYKSFNIYITSDEEIKMDDWYLDDTNSVRQAITECESYWTHRKKYQKIILTTDQSLDGVQPIDDEFLEWFVNNPSCEKVDIKEKSRCCGRCDGVNDLCYTDQYCDNHHQCGCEICYGKAKKYQIIIPKEEPKQETLEEVAALSEKQLRKMAKQVCNGHQHAMRYRNMLNACFKMGQTVLEECTERMYSEEEVKDIVEQTIEKFYKHTYADKTKAEMKELWFEQFKKK